MAEKPASGAALYILCGPPFAGKTTLAKELARRLGFSRVAIDEINDERGVWDDENGLSPEEWAQTYAEAYRRIDALLTQGQRIVDDSVNYTRDLRDRLRAIADKRDAPTTVVLVDVPLAEVSRRRQENRRTGLRGDLRDADFAYVVDNFEPPTADENVVRYDGSIPLEEWIDETFNDSAIEARRRTHILDRSNTGYATLRADPRAWQEILDERAEWDATLTDGLEGDVYPID